MEHVRVGSDPIAALRAALAGHYEIDRQLGQGAFANVYLAHDLRHDRQVAVKVLVADPSTDLPEMRFMREIKLLARLQHPNILPLHDSGHLLNLLYYVMPYVTGETLREKLLREQRLELGFSVALARELADALEYAHQNGVIHRDIKPENILLSGSHPMLADFGIAQMVDSARVRHLTRTGIGSPGTPAYMSPEQMLGETGIDGRSDIYSLGCVLFEMLGGSPPFSGPSGFGRRCTEPPPSVREHRDVPRRIDDALRRALARLPDDRFANAAAFAAALASADQSRASERAPRLTQYTPPDTPIPSAPAASPAGEPLPFLRDRTRAAVRWWASIPPRRRYLAVLPVLVVAALTVLLSPWLRSPLQSADLSSSTYVVLPFAERDSDAASTVDGERAERMLYDALSRWRDLHLVGALQVNDAVARAGAPSTFADALALARGLGAGILAWGDVTAVGDSIEVRAGLYDVARRGRALREHTMVLGAGSDARTAFAGAAAILLRGHPDDPAGRDSGGTLSLAAWRAYERGQEALAHWDLPAAQSEFRSAARLDPDFPQPNLWLAEMMMWTGQGPTQRAEWRTHAARVARQAAAIPQTDAMLATALHALASEHYPQACEEARRLLAADSLRFSAWYLLGECNRLDPIVVPDAASPSGWSYRGSYHTAVRAYRRAFELVPSFHLALRSIALGHVDKLLITEATMYRPGVSATGDSLRFMALPGLMGDTLAYVPRLIRDVQRLRAAVEPPRLVDAVTRNREVLREVAEAWVQAFPRSAPAHEVYGRALESLGDVGDEERGALAAVRRARTLAADPVQAMRLARSEVRLQLKRGDFARAERLADSLLAPTAGRSDEELALLAPVAALAGRVHAVAAMLRTSPAAEAVLLPDGQPLAVPPALAAVERSLLAYASLGAPVDSLLVMRQRVDRMVRSYIPAPLRDEARTAILGRPMMLAFPALGADAVRGIEPGGILLLRLEQRLVRGDTAAVRAALAAERRARGTRLPGWTTMDATWLEAALALAAGDSAAAIEQLDLSLNALPTLAISVGERTPQAGALVRAMALRAELAAARGDRATAQRWAAAVATLWVSADPPLQPVVAQMREVIRTP